MREWFATLALFVFLVVAGCDSAVTITADTVVTVGGVDDTARIRVSVAGDPTPIAGRYSVVDGAVRFRPAFPFDSGRGYEVVVQSDGGARLVHHFQLPAPDRRPSTRVTRIYPTLDTLPENQLRIYVEFSAPMSRDGGLPFVKLLDANGNEVKGAFLPLDADFWNRDHTRYTLFLDPGRVKRGILPNEQLGRALIAGRGYSIVVDSAWRDGRGQPLVASHMKRFRAAPADYRPLALDRWRVEPPRAGTRDPLVINFGEPLDHGLLNRAVGVENDAGVAIDGTLDVPAGERQLRFVPAGPWVAARHRVIVLDFLEDLAGNRVNRAFEVDMFERADSTAKPSEHKIEFRIR